MRLDQMIGHWAGTFRQSGIETAQLDARLIVKYALGLSDVDMLVQFDRILSESEQDNIACLGERRLKREPVAHLVGKREFWGLDFAVNGDVLVPRPDSETLVQAVLDDISDPRADLTLLDIGTGSGCLLLSLLSELPNAHGIAVDKSPAALEMAQQNAKALGLWDRVLFVCGDYATAFLPVIAGKIDYVISNPPYLAEVEFAGLDADVANYDPYLALVSGASGLEAYDSILSSVVLWPAPKPGVYFEIGHQQAGDLQQLVWQYEGYVRALRQDLGGRDRVVVVGF
ncbi:MAG: peptide chain release factor N(5)-glutamine methyltransferase [Cohaesibacter sp.]|nr:peptide chain release factor N(5)-glutamine methyltransferase [Cohaesibacter sp.]